jgi:hypothetical protein
MRAHLFEFEDLAWCPAVIRDGGTDYLSFIIEKSRIYEPCVRVINELSAATGADQITDLCSGGGGPYETLAMHMNKNIRVVLTDKFPHAQWQNKPSNHGITYHPTPLDCTNTCATGKIATMFSAIHHFEKEKISAIIKTQAQNRQAIAFFDGGNKSFAMIAGILVIHPLLFLFCTPFLKPFSLKRLFFTYVLPFIPIMTIWDGCVSILRLYEAEELLDIAKDSAPGYKWEAGRIRSAYGLSCTYLKGIPEERCDT